MKTLKFFAIAAAVVAVASCKQPSAYESLVAEAQQDQEVMNLTASVETVDSVSYLLGVNYGLMFKGNGFFDEASQLNMDEFKKGLEAAMLAGEPKNPYAKDEEWAKNFKVSPYDMNQIFNEYLGNRRAFKALLNKKIGEKYLAKNLKTAGVVATESGLQYRVAEEGYGDVVAVHDTITIKYTGKLIDGTEFDSNDSFELQLRGLDGRDNVIDGWVEGIALLSEGAKATLYIPADLAYGANAPRGSVIEPNSTLIFDVEVLKVKKYQEPVAEQE